MANYTAAQMNAGVLGEVLTAGTDYTFTFATPAYTSQSVYFNSAQFVVDSSTNTNVGLQGSSTNAKVGALKGGIIPLSNVVDEIDGAGLNATFTFDVDGDLQGSSAQIALTATLLDGDATATITRANVIRGGQNFISGDGITISLNDIQAAGFTNATNPVAPFTGGLQMDIFPNHIDGWYTPADLAGTFGTTTGDLTTTNFVYNYRNSGSSLEVLTSVGFKLKQTLDTPLAAGVIGSFQYTPTATIQALTYTLQCTGNVSLNIT